MENPMQTGSLSESEVAKLLWDRWMHIERLLITTILAMFFTTTIAVFAAASKMTDRIKGNLPCEDFFLFGVGLAYGILAGYYYFMLAQNYAAMVCLLKINRNILGKVSALWEFFKPKHVAVGGFWHQTLLLPAAGVPLVIAILALVGLRLMLTNAHSIFFWIPILIHIGLFIIMIWSPFREFIHTIKQVAT